VIMQGHEFGRDGYGKYPILTGHEAPKRCFYCGCEIRQKNRRYCSPEHREAYWTEYSLTEYWPHVSQVCILRATNGVERYCERCGEKTDPGEVHHKQPLLGDRQTWHPLHRIENLIFVCHKCHLELHAEDRLNRKNAQD